MAPDAHAQSARSFVAPSSGGLVAARAATHGADAARAARAGTPSRDASVAGVRLASRDTAQPAVVLAVSRTGRGQTLAIVGGAAFLGGLLIGDDVGTAIAVGGLAVGVYGLWLWLK